MSTAALAIGTKSVPWYIEDYQISELDPNTRKIFEEYSCIPPTEVRTHILQLRNKAWDIFPFPCIGQMRFVDFSLSTMPSYQTIVARLQDTESSITLLDVGCCFGQDLRKLLFDGAIGKQLLGIELKQQFISLGFDLFKDRETYPGRFIAGNIFDKTVIGPLEGQLDVIHAASFLHLFGLEGQVRALVLFVSLLKDKLGTLVLGRNVGSETPGEYPHKTNESGVAFFHNVETFGKLWKEVGEKTGTRWNVQASLEQPTSSVTDPKQAQFKENKIVWLIFEATRE